MPQPVPPASTTSDPHKQNAQALAVLVLLAALLLFTPLFRAGTTPLPALTAQLLALGLLVLSLWSPKRLALSGAEIGVLVLLLLTPWLYLLPLPADWAAALPGREPYLQALGLLPGASPESYDQLSLYPLASAGAGLALLLPAAVFLATRSLDAPKLILLVKILLGVAALQAVLGLVQSGAAQSGNFAFAVEPIGRSHKAFGTGTYANKNHLAGLLEMVLPLSLALLFYAVGRGAAHRAPGRWRRRAAFVSSAKGHAALVYGALTVLLIVGIIFSRSRTGIALAMLGILLAGVFFSRRIGGSNVFGPAGTITALALSFGIAIGLAPVLQRFSVDVLSQDGRITMFESALQGAGTLLPVGSGPGTFAAAYPPFQPIELGHFFVNRAHNDYIQWLFDAGVLGIVLPLLILGLYGWQWSRVYTRHTWSQVRFVQVGAGIGLLLLALHEIVDYNLYTPANQVVFALLAGLFFIPPQRLESDATPERERQRRRTPDLAEQPELAPAPAPTAAPNAGTPPGSQSAAPSGAHYGATSGPRRHSAAPPPDQIENPFRDAPAPPPSPRSGPPDPSSEPR